MLELEQFGWNALTISFLATTAFALLGAWGLKQQLAMIRRNRSAKALSVMWFAVLTFMFASFSLYGIEKQSLALILQGVMRVPILVMILLELVRYKPLSKRQWGIIMVLAAGLLYMPISDHGVIVFLVLSYLGLAAAVLQPLAMWRVKSAGVVSIKLLMVNTASVAFWVAYGLIIGDVAVWLMSLSYVIVYGATVGLWLRYCNEAVMARTAAEMVGRPVLPKSGQRDTRRLVDSIYSVGRI